MKRNAILRVRNLVLCSASFFLVPPAFAKPPASAGEDQDSSSKIGDIIVTARRVEESQQSVPISITTFSNEAIRTRGIVDVTDIARLAPNVDLATGGGNSNSPGVISASIRGIGQTDFIITSDPGVGIYVDGVYVARATGGALDLSDVERVEVLRGPQGTLFGKNTIGGALNVTTLRPTKTARGSLQVDYGSYNRVDVRGVASGPLSDSVRLKAALTYKRRDGYGNRLSTGPGGTPGTTVIGKEGGIDDVIVRLGVEADLSSRLQAYATFDYTRNRDQQIPGEIRVVDPAAGFLGLYNALVAGPAGVPVSVAQNNAGRYNSYNTGPGSSNQDIYGGQLTLEYSGETVTAKLISGYRRVSSNIVRDGDGTAADLLSSAGQLRQKQFSEELQLFGSAFDDRLTWLVGGYYLHENASEPTQGIVVRGLYRALEALPAPLIPVGVAPGGQPILAGGKGNPVNVGFDFDFLYQFRQVTDSYAAFGQATFKLAPKLNLTGGLRYTSESKAFNYSL